MRDLHNIEKSGFRPGEYVGYRGGKVYRIRKGGVRGSLRVAMETNGGRITGAPFIFGKTLADLSARLAEGPTAVHA
jgi:hypothetical protein